MLLLQNFICKHVKTDEKVTVNSNPHFIQEMNYREINDESSAEINSGSVDNSNIVENPLKVLDNVAKLRQYIVDGSDVLFDCSIVHAEQIMQLCKNDFQLVKIFADTIISHESFHGGMNAIFNTNCSIEYSWVQPLYPSVIVEHSPYLVKAPYIVTNEFELKHMDAKVSLVELERQDKLLNALRGSDLIEDLINIIVQYSKPAVKISRGMFLDVLDVANVWTIGKVQNLYDFRNRRVLHISYLNWDSYHDEYLLLDSPRIRLLYNYKDEIIFNWEPCKFKKGETCKRGEKMVECRQRTHISWKIGPLKPRKFTGNDDFAPFFTFVNPADLSPFEISLCNLVV